MQRRAPRRSTRLVDGTVALANIPYQGASSYVPVASGAHTVTVEAATAPGATIASAQPPFPAATDTSIVLTGNAGRADGGRAVRQQPARHDGQRARALRQCRAGLGAVDVLVNFARRVSALGTNAASGYLELVEDTYAINFDVAGTTQRRAEHAAGVA